MKSIKDIDVSGKYDSLNLQIKAGSVGVNEISSSIAGEGLGGGGGSPLKINLKNLGGLEIVSDELALNQSCSNDQILKFKNGMWLCDEDVGVTGTGTPGYLAKWDTSTSLTDANIYESGGSIYVKQDLLPDLDNSRSLGSSSKRWKDVYAVNVNASNYVNASRIFIGEGNKDSPSIYLNDKFIILNKLFSVLLTLI